MATLTTVKCNDIGRQIRAWTRALDNSVKPSSLLLRLPQPNSTVPSYCLTSAPFGAQRRVFSPHAKFRL